MDVKSDITAYWNGRSDTYDRFPASRAEGEEKKAFKAVFRRYLSKEALDILDAGAGTGFLSLFLAEMGHRVTALDITEGMLEKARQKARTNNLKIDFHIGDAEDLPFAAGTFDCVVCRWLLWTLPDPERAVQQWVRVIKPGGTIICIDGQWKDSSLRGRFKRLCRKAGIFLYEKTDPRELGYTSEISRSLPFADGVDTGSAVDLFKSAGLDNIITERLTCIRNVRAKNMRLLYRLALPPATFIIKGEKNKKEYENN